MGRGTHGEDKAGYVFPAAGRAFVTVTLLLDNPDMLRAARRSALIASWIQYVAGCPFHCSHTSSVRPRAGYPVANGPSQSLPLRERSPTRREETRLPGAAPGSPTRSVHPESDGPYSSKVLSWSTGRGIFHLRCGRYRVPGDRLAHSFAGSRSPALAPPTAPPGTVTGSAARLPLPPPCWWWWWW